MIPIPELLFIAETIKRLTHMDKDSLGQIGVRSREYYLNNFDKDSIFDGLL